MMMCINWYLWEDDHRRILHLPKSIISARHLTELVWGHSISAATIDVVGKMISNSHPWGPIFTKGNRPAGDSGWRFWDAFCFPFREPAGREGTGYWQ